MNDVLREWFVQGNGDGRIRLHQEMLSGAGAGFFQVAATNPMEIVKLRMQLQGEAGAGARKSCVRERRVGASASPVALWGRRLV